VPPWLLKQAMSVRHPVRLSGEAVGLNLTADNVLHQITVAAQSDT
jgi:hypothetical protein